MTASYYERTDEHRFKPTEHTGGAWHDDEQHFSPVGGLITHAIDQFLQDHPAPGLTVSRLSFDILGRIAREECEIQVRTTRPGRTVQLVEAVLEIGGRSVVQARAWLLTTLDTTAVADTPVPAIAPPEAFPAWDMTGLWDGGYIDSLEVRREAPRPGRTTAWLTTPVTLVAGEPSSPLASYLTLVDTANGIAVQRSPREWMFPNVDLTVHLHRQPQGPWTGLDTTVSFGPAGHGVTSTVLHDLHGPLGTAQQSLTVRPL
ncbi:hypothetical protein JOF53_000959 [Crossiella equi]|uniref:Thioesterase family protein n=1 Tax=Crossiella equi TaxID=130796 RepID=A0ABS5A668_9PSEU|nr:thioesterase family protein [Crossiella equi]MBP2472087.1 hypothetical protein [Crossiella equi]